MGICGILFLLKLVTTPASIITKGIVQGDLNPMNTNRQEHTKIHFVMVLLIAFLKSTNVALIIKAMDIGFKYMSTESPAAKICKEYKIAINAIKVQAGKIQTNMVKKASV